jgi:hypothetical protein
VLDPSVDAITIKIYLGIGIKIIDFRRRILYDQHLERLISRDELSTGDFVSVP